MNENRRFAAVWLLLLVGIGGAASAQEPIVVEPVGLSKRHDLIGREVIVDDRVKMFFPPPKGRGIAEILLKRTEIPIQLPAQFRYDSTPGAKAVRAQGILKMDGNVMILEATRAPELFRSDLDRIQKIVKTLAPEDAESRSGWGDWVASRADAFNDVELKAVADRLQAEAIAIEFRRPSTRSPESIVALAAKARKKAVAEPEPSAFIHLALRLKMATAKTSQEFRQIAEDVFALLPNSKSPANTVARLPFDEYKDDPVAVYRKADSETRAAFDRRLFSDALSESLRLRATADPAILKTLADEAKAKIPERPEIAGEFRQRMFEAKSANVAKLSETEMRELVRTYREDLKKPAEADAKIRTWLDYQRKNYLGPNNSEQRDELAKLYWTDLKDKTIAAELLRESLKIDPTDRGAIDLFQRMGFVKSGEDWRDPSSRTSDPTPSEVIPIKGDGFLGLTPVEVRAKLGEPKFVSRVATQGCVSIQWMYESAKGSQYIDFIQRAGDAQPTVVGRFSVR